MTGAGEIIKKLGLALHPAEGGYYRETYRSEEVIPRGSLPPRYGADKSCSTAIYYLLTPESCSLLHRLKTDEIIHFYLGDPVTMLQLSPEGGGRVIVLGADLGSGQEVQVVVPRGTWMGMCMPAAGEFALMGATVAPGFDFSDYEGGMRSDLIRKYPGFKDLIFRLTPEETNKE